MSAAPLSIEQIAARLQGYDPQALSADAVGEFLAHLVTPVQEHESVGVLEALGRVLARDLVSPISVPPHDNSAMDGFAFAGAQLAQGALQLQVVGTALAGAAWQGSVGPGRVTDVIESTLPRERPLDIRETPEFLAIAARVRDGLRAGHSYEEVV